MVFVFLYIAGLCMLLSAREGGVRLAGFLIAAGALSYLFETHWDEMLAMVFGVAGGLLLIAFGWLSRFGPAGRHPQPSAQAKKGNMLN